MVSPRDIRRKIRTVNNIKKITDAMRMVAAAKLQRVQAKVAQARPYADKMSELMGHVAPFAADVEHPLLEVRDPPERVALVTISADRGLCGSFNTNILRRTTRFVEEQGVPTTVVTVGRKVGAYCARQGYDVHRRFEGLSAESSAMEIGEMSAEIRGLYEPAAVDRVYILYTEFVNAMVQRPMLKQFLPFEPPEMGDEDESEQQVSEYIFEPDPKAVMEGLIPRYVDTMVYHLILESTASEHGARMMAMTNASTNAGEMIEDLTREYNKARQATITGELLEIVSGADALEQV